MNKEEILKLLNESENKSEAIAQVIAQIKAEQSGEVKNMTGLVEGITNKLNEVEAKILEAASKNPTAQGMEKLSAEEDAFINSIKNIQNSVTGAQIDILPVSVVDKTLEDIKKESDLLQLINFAPSGVTKWFTAAKTGAAGWGTIDASITAELTASFKGLNLELHKLSGFLVIPKSIRTLANEFVMTYVRAILAETMRDGIINAFLTGDGATGPIGIMKSFSTENLNATATSKTAVTTLTSFTPKLLAPILNTLSNSGKRAVGKLHIIANPSDAYTYVYPALYGEGLFGGYTPKSFKEIVVHEEPLKAAGTAVITIEGVYTMGLSNTELKEYKETKALDDADLFIAKAYGNGRATDNNTAVVIDVTVLEEYVLPVTQVTAA